MKRFSYGTITVLFLLVVLAVNARGESWNELIDRFQYLRQNAKYEEGMAVADKIIETWPNHSYGYNGKALMLSGMNKLEEAIEYYKKASQFSAADRYVFMRNIGSAYRRLNRFDEAIEYYKKALSENNNIFAVCMFDIADIYLLKGDKEKARAAYKDAIPKIEASEQFDRKTNETNKGNTYSKAAWVAYQLGENDAALHYAKTTRDLKGTDSIKLSYAMYLARIGQKENAKTAFSTVSIDNCTPLYVAQFYLLVDDNVNAERYFQRSVEAQRTPAQLEAWRLAFKRDALYPYDDWAKARKLAWFTNVVQK